MMSRLKLLLGFFLLGGALGLFVSIAQAANITVNTANPNINADGLCSLIEAIDNANNDAQIHADCPTGNGADVVILQASEVYTLTQVNNNASGANGLPILRDSLTIEGNNATIARSQAAGVPDFRILRITSTAQITINQVKMRYGHYDSIWGGDETAPGIRNSGGAVYLNQVVVTENYTENDNAGGVWNEPGGSMTLVDSIVSSNKAVSGGGVLNEGELYLIDTIIQYNRTYDADGAGLLNNGGTATLTNSQIRNNYTNSNPDSGGGGISNSGVITLFNTSIARNSGGFGNSGIARIINSDISYNGSQEVGGILNGSSGVIELVGSTVSNNSTYEGGYAGGGIFNWGVIHSTNSTISQNSADFSGGGIFNRGTITLTHSTVVSNKVTSSLNYVKHAGISNSGILVAKSSIIARNSDYIGLSNCSGI
ncbi:MAG: hypothetical protein AAF485_26900, partial [Chloroflexota bacterium]